MGVCHVTPDPGLETIQGASLMVADLHVAGCSTLHQSPFVIGVQRQGSCIACELGPTFPARLSS